MTLHKLYHPLLLIIMTATLVLSGWHSFAHPYNINLRDQAEWQISAQQAEILHQLDSVYIEAYVTRNPHVRRSIDSLLRPLQTLIPSVNIQFYNPETEPLKVRERNISKEGQLYIHDGTGHGILVSLPSPAHIIDALLALQPANKRQIIHLQGHGERGFLSDEAGSWRETYQHLQQSGITIAAANPQSIASIPLGTDVLVLAAPEPDSIDDDKIIDSYLAKGGNILYTTDYPAAYLPDWLKKISGLESTQGQIIDPDSQQYGIEDTKMLLITNLGDVDAVRSLKNAPLLAQAVALVPVDPTATGWTRQALLFSSPQASIEGDDIQKGPFAIGWLISRKKPNSAADANLDQRIIILGDSDLFSQHYRQVAGNAALIDSLFNTLLPERSSIATASSVPLSDQYITLSKNYQYGLAILLLCILPISWCCYYFYYYRKQKCRYQ